MPSEQLQKRSDVMKNTNKPWRMGILSLILLSISRVYAAEWYVDAINGNDANAGTHWATARQTLVSAVSLASSGDTVWAANGVYNRGKADTPGAERDCRVVLDGVKLKATPEASPVIDGINDPTDTSGTYDDDDARCVFMLNGAELQGFTIRNGISAINDTAAANYLNNAGGGIYVSGSCTVRNCTLTNNTATRGGAIYLREGGHVQACEIVANTSTLYGGGLYLFKGGVIGNSFLHNNSAANNGGGLYFYQGGTATSCTLRDNQAGDNGNEIDFSGGGSVFNSIAWNINGAMDRTFNANSIRYVCTTDGMGHGVNNCITNNPSFSGEDDRLQTNSPCIDAGSNNLTSDIYDRVGALRKFGGIDMGSRETPGTSTLKGSGVPRSVTAPLGSTNIQSCRTFMANFGNLGASWTLTNTPPAWLSFSSTNGYVRGNNTPQTGALLTLDYYVDPAGLPAGTYAATNLFTTDSTTETVPEVVTLEILDAKLFVAAHAFDADFCGASVAEQITLENNGDVVAEWSVNVSESWLDIDPASGSLASGASTNLSFTATPDGLPPGTYTNTNTFSAPSLENPFEQVVTLRIRASELSISDHSFTALLNSPHNRTDERVLVNSGGTAAEWSLNALPDWLSVVPLSGTLASGASTALVFTAHAPGLTLGTHTATNIYSATSMASGSITQRVVFVIEAHDFYVSPTGSDTNSGTHAATPLHSIQQAVIAQETPGGKIYLQDGLYLLPESVSVSNDVVIQSMNGPETTFVDGGGTHRCFNLFGDSAGWLNGVTLQNGHAVGTGEAGYGGGVFIDRGFSISNCIFAGNFAEMGGAVYGGTIFNSIFTNNTAAYGGALAHAEAYSCAIYDNRANVKGGAGFAAVVCHSTITDNSAPLYGGLCTDGPVYESAAVNSIIYYNAGGNIDLSRGDDYIRYCCAPELDVANGNITNAPLLISSIHLATNSPCIGAATNWGMAFIDIDGELFRDPPSIGCDAPIGPFSGGINLSIEGLPARIFRDTAIDFRLNVDGAATRIVLDFGDGSTEEGNPFPTHTWNSSGNYDVVLTAYNDDYPDGIVVSQQIQVGTLEELAIHVSKTGDDADTGFNWSTAKGTLAAGVAAQDIAGGTVLVSNGIYSIASELVVTNNIVLQGWAGAANTILDGGGDSRCLNLSGCALDGFTIQNGYADGMDAESGSGGGVIARETILRNCIFKDNIAKLGGGGVAASSCTVSNCQFSSNEAEVIWLADYVLYGGAGGGAAIENSEIHNCVFSDNAAHYGGGVALSNSTGSACAFIANAASCHGGGAFVINSAFSNAAFSANSASQNGGAIYFEGGGSLFSMIGCTNNTAGAYGGGIYIYDKSDTEMLEDTECWYLSLRSNHAGRYGGGAYLWHGGMITRSSISGNHADAHGGGVSFRISGGVYRSEIFDNTAVTNGGGVYFSEGGNLRETSVFGNQSQRGAGLYHYKDGDANNVLLHENQASVRGGGVYCYQGGTLNSITTSGNSAVEAGSGFYAYSATNSTSWIQLENAIVWEATDPMCRIGSNMTVRHICSNEINTNGIENIITADPLFINPSATNYQLQALSPCIDTGRWSANIRKLDLALNKRVMGWTIDLGAYEWDFDSDTDNDGLPDAWEQHFFGNPTNAHPSAMAANNIYSLSECYAANLDPTDPNSRFEILDFTVNPATLFFDSSPSRRYTLLGCTNLTEGVWSLLGSKTGNISGLDSMSAPGVAPHQRFFRVTVELP